MGLVNDVPSSKNRRGFSRGPGHLKSVCCLTTVEMEEVVLTLWEDLWSSSPQRKHQSWCSCGVELLQRALWFSTTTTIILQRLGGEQSHQSKEETLPVHSMLPPLFAEHQQRHTTDERSLLGQAVSKHHPCCCLPNSPLRGTEQILSNITKPRDEHQVFSLN